MVLVILVTSLIPLVALAGASIMSMSSRNSRLLEEISMERALMAAESGIDEAIYLGLAGKLTSGVDVSRDFGEGYQCYIEPLYLKTDGFDNDEDGQTDEADENVFRLVVTGYYRDKSRKIVAYVGPTPGLPALSSPATIAADPSLLTEFEVEAEDLGIISGFDVTPLDVPVVVGDALKDQDGVMIADPGTLPELLAALKIKDGGQIIGEGPSPSTGKDSKAIDVTAIVDLVRDAADTVLTNKEISGADLGNASTGDFRIIFRNGELELEDGGRGAGIMVVTGGLEIEDGFRFDGVIICLGECELDDGAIVNGAVIVAPGSEEEDYDEDEGPELELELEVEDGAILQYSSELVNQVSTLLPGKFVIFNGWQEIGTN